MEMINRARRMRRNPLIRGMVRETRVSSDGLIYPIFFEEGKDIKAPIASLDGQFRYSPDRAREAIDECLDHGINKVRLQRDLGGVSGYEENNRFWMEQGFITTAHFGRPWDIANGRIPDDTEILVHPVFDHDGAVIDKRGEKDGYPTGNPLLDYGKIDSVTLLSYRDLSNYS